MPPARPGAIREGVLLGERGGFLGAAAIIVSKGGSLHTIRRHKWVLEERKVALVISDFNFFYKDSCHQQIRATYFEMKKPFVVEKH